MALEVFVEERVGKRPTLALSAALSLSRPCFMGSPLLLSVGSGLGWRWERVGSTRRGQQGMKPGLEVREDSLGSSFGSGPLMRHLC